MRNLKKRERWTPVSETAGVPRGASALRLRSGYGFETRFSFLRNALTPRSIASATYQFADHLMGSRDREHHEASAQLRFVRFGEIACFTFGSGVRRRYRIEKAAVRRIYLVSWIGSSQVRGGSRENSGGQY